jgi:50S ribosomal subunit-associated GTPase HflX
LIGANPAAIIAANKSDLAPSWHADDLCFQSRAIVTVSAETGDGLSGLVDLIGHKLVPKPPPTGSAVPFRREQVAQLRRIRMNLLSGDRMGATDQLAEMIHRRKPGNQSESVAD